MSRPSIGGGIPLITERIVESAVAPGPFWKIGEGILVKEAEVVVKQVRRQLSNLNLHSVAHDMSVFLCKSIRAAFEDLLET